MSGREVNMNWRWKYCGALHTADGYELLVVDEETGEDFYIRIKPDGLDDESRARLRRMNEIQQA